MKCPFCGHSDTQVIDSRVLDEGSAIRRRRRCQSCDKRFTTFERIEFNMPIVVKRNGMRTEFNLEKVRDSMRTALRKRPVSAEDFDMAVVRIQEAVFNKGEKEVSTGEIGELVMTELKHLDQVAYVRFASVYKSFQDIDEFVQAIKEIRLNKK